MKLCYGCFEKHEEELDICPYCGHEDGEGSEEPLHLEPGRMLKDTYIIGKVLGYGGFGVTYLGWNTVLEQKVAIKEYLPSEFSTRMQGQTKVTIFNGDKSEQFHDGVDKFVEEANRLAQFRNTNGIVRIFESFKENNTAYIVMEYLDGETLTKHLEKSGQFSADQAVKLMTPIIQSLQIVHEQGIIHRDIAPDNIMITKDGGVKLIDFGAARYATTSRSRSLTVVIKPGYSPEEQYRSRGDQGAWTDVYAVGATMYRMITGQTPPDAMERRAFFEGKKKDILFPITKYSKQINENMETAILNAMNVRIEDRTPDMQTFEQELNSQDEVKRRYGRIKKIDLLKWPLWTKIAIPAAACAVTIVSLLFAFGIIGFDAALKENIYVPQGMARVPSIVSNEIANAQTRLTEAKLLYSIAGKKYSEDIPANLILKQDLAAGSIVPSNSVVKIEISGGKEMDLTEKDKNGKLSLADVQYRTKDEAITILKSQGMNSTFAEQSSETVEAGVVISQDPIAGTLLDPNSEITLLISTGGAKFDMPNVVGKAEAVAKSELSDKGLSVKVEFAKDDKVAVGNVISQSMKSGDKVNKGDAVTITVSSGKSLINVANVVGKTGSEAKSTLQGQGFQTAVNDAYSNTVPKGSVVSQSPSAGSSQEKGVTVVITVSLGKQFTITFSANGGTVAPAAYKVVEGNTLGVLTSPSRDYYSFNGWFTASSGGQKVSETTIPTSDMTLYAQWSQKALSGWVTTSSVPAGAQVVNHKWIYSHTQTFTSSSNPSGYNYISTSYGSWSGWSGWSTASVSKQYNPFDGSQLVRDVQTRDIPATGHTEYHYYRWTNRSGWYTYKKDSTYWLEEKWISNQYVASSDGLCDVSGDGIWVTADSIYNHSVDKTFTRWVQDTSARTEYSSQTRSATYTYRRDNIEVTIYPSGSDVSNIVEYVQYRLK